MTDMNPFLGKNALNVLYTISGGSKALQAHIEAPG